VTIEKGQDWGEAGPLPDDGVLVRSDAEARAVVTTARRANEPIPPLGLLGGDLCRTVGGRGDEGRLLSGEGTRLTVDVGSVLIDGRLHWFVAHLVARRSWLRGPLLGVFNAEWLGEWDVAPRAHPGDGLLEVVEVTMSAGDRLKARRRLPTGTHLPHPGIEVRRADAVQRDIPKGHSVWLDGERLGPAGAVSIRVEPDALRIVV
jgi:YegS C-terminal NAD kinase beta sandwich-like domain